VLALAACFLLSACGSRQSGADQGGIDAPGFLVFSGMPSGSYLHAMRPDGGDLREVDLPRDCSPDHFTRDGRLLLCFDLGGADGDGLLAFERMQASWRRVPVPPEARFPNWAREDSTSDDYEDYDTLGTAPEWAPGGDRIAFIRPSQSDYDFWFSSRGEVVVADDDHLHESVVAEDGQAPAWSPDGRTLSFARCSPSKMVEKDWRPYDTAKCSLWTVPADGSHRPELLADNAASVPVWSPDSRFVAFLREVRCETYCIDRIFVVPAEGGEALSVGPDLVKPRDGFEWWSGLAWVPDAAPVVSSSGKGDSLDLPELQRCVDVWNRARMFSFPTGAVNVSLVEGRCQITLSDYGGVCTQSVEMPFRFWCPSHGAGLHQLPTEDRVWNGHGAEDGKVSLFDPSKAPRLPLPKAPPYPMLDGYVIPYGKDGELLADLKLTETSGTCYGTGEPDRYPLSYPDRYPARCWWDGSGSEHCFKQPGRLADGDIVLCPQSVWDEVYDPMHFFKVKVTDLEL
jgi:WD40-like Beta Propeller Repeat